MSQEAIGFIGMIVERRRHLHGDPLEATVQIDWEKKPGSVALPGECPERSFTKILTSQ